MKPLFKYIRKEYCHAFFRDGTLRIGTLHEYRNEEALGLIIGDSEEGVGRTVTRFRDLQDHKDYWEAKRKTENKDRPPTIVAKITSTKIIAILSESNRGLISTTFSDNCYIYCVTNKFDANVMNEFGCDTCIRINDPFLFFKEISNCISTQATFYGCRRVVYRDRLTHFTKPRRYPLALLKAPKYKYQAEVRAIWRPTDTIDGPLFIKVPLAARYCDIVNQ